MGCLAYADFWGYSVLPGGVSGKGTSLLVSGELVCWSRLCQQKQVSHLAYMALPIVRTVSGVGRQYTDNGVLI